MSHVDEHQEGVEVITASSNSTPPPPPTPPSNTRAWSTGTEGRLGGGPTVGVADPGAEGGGRGQDLSAGGLMPRLLSLALAHPARGQKNALITAAGCWGGEEAELDRGGGVRGSRAELERGGWS